MLCCDLSVSAPSAFHDRHVFFENSAADGSYYHSEASVVAPSTLEIVDGKSPVDVRRFSSPPNSLRLAWKSAPGGDWRWAVKTVNRYGRRFDLEGDALVLWCYADEPLAPEGQL